MMTPPKPSLSPSYLRRRDGIRARALNPADPRPQIDYTRDEQQVWKTVWDQLRPLHLTHACAPVLSRLDELALHDGPIPQLEQLSAKLKAASGIELVAVPELTDPAEFFGFLRRRQFPSTQYVRDPESPFYTPEPDLIHEFVGHAATLLDPRIADLCESFGKAADGAAPARLRELERVFWFSMEYGMVAEGGSPRCFGAGLLSSCAELEQCQQVPTLHPWNLDIMGRTNFDSTRLQSQLFVAHSFDRMLLSLREWLANP